MNKKSITLLLGLGALLMGASAFAGIDCTLRTPTNPISGCEFNDGWLTVQAWTGGTFGKMIAGGLVLVGLVAGMAKGNLMAFATRAGSGLGLGMTPTIIASMLPATADQVIGAVDLISNIPLF
jgi:hypothetical protein